MSHTWLYNPATADYWNAPDALVKGLLEGGWEDRGAPSEHNPATAEHAAWREAEAKKAAAEAATQKKAAKTTTTKAAASAESQEG